MAASAKFYGTFWSLVPPLVAIAMAPVSYTHLLIVKMLRSHHANAWVEDIKTGTAEKVVGIACILTYKDVPQKRFTLAGPVSYTHLDVYKRQVRQ